MSIKEIIDAERWTTLELDHREHNASLDRIEAKMKDTERNITDLLTKALEPISFAYSKGLVGAEELGRNIEAAVARDKEFEAYAYSMERQRNEINEKIARLETVIEHLRHGGKVQREEINRVEGILYDIGTACDEAGREKESPKTIAGFIKDQAKRITELEKRPELLPTMGLMMQVVDVQEKRIEELEAQLPKVAKAKNGCCTNCGSVCGYNFCQHCGAKLDWSEA